MPVLPDWKNPDGAPVPERTGFDSLWNSLLVRWMRRTEPKELCAARELEEETGYRSDDLKHLITVNTNSSLSAMSVSEIYTAENLIPTSQHLDEDEDIEVEAYSLESLLAMIYAGKITDAKTSAGILAYAMQNR